MIDPLLHGREAEHRPHDKNLGLSGAFFFARVLWSNIA